MKNTRRLQTGLLIFFLVFISGNLIAQETFYVYFLQNGKRVNVKESKIELKKQAFDIYVEYTNPMDLLVHASLDSKTWHAAEKGRLLYNLPPFNETNSAVSTVFDYDNTLILNADSVSVWKKNQSDTIENLRSAKGRHINIKKVLKFWLPGDTLNIYAKDFDKDLYLVFIYTEKDKNNERIEIQRETIKIKWVKKFEEETKSYQHKKKVLAKEKIHSAKLDLKRKQKNAKKEEQRMLKLEKDKQKRIEKEKSKAEKEKKKETKKKKNSVKTD